MGKAIYMPKGKAQEYNKYAVNFFNGCSGDCSYCYCKKYPMSQFWSTTPTLKKSLVDEKTAIVIFEKELLKNLLELQEHGLFFNFSSDPFLPEAQQITFEAARLCNQNDVPCIFLTKQANWYDLIKVTRLMNVVMWPSNSIGFTLTGHDKLEPGCATNNNRIEVMKEMFGYGVNTWASIEPVINFGSSEEMVAKTVNICSHYKIGLQSGVKQKPEEIRVFMNKVNFHISFSSLPKIPTIYWKDSLLEQAGVSRDELPQNCVNADYKFWKE